MRIKPIICKLGSDAVGSICDYESATIAFITAVSKFKVPADCKRHKHTEIYERLALAGGGKSGDFNWDLSKQMEYYTTFLTMQYVSNMEFCEKSYEKTWNFVIL